MSGNPPSPDWLSPACCWLECSEELNNTDQVTQEHPVKEQPTRPVTVMRTMSCGMRHTNRWGGGSKKNQRQCRARTNSGPAYADWLEKEYGQRPVIFYTNATISGCGMTIKLMVIPRVGCWLLQQGKPAISYSAAWNPSALNSVPHVKDNEGKAVAGRLSSLKPLPVSASGLPTSTDNRNCSGYGYRQNSRGNCTKQTEIDARWVKRVLFLCDRKELRNRRRMPLINSPMSRCM